MIAIRAITLVTFIFAGLSIVFSVASLMLGHATRKRYWRERGSR